MQCKKRCNGNYQIFNKTNLVCECVSGYKLDIPVSTCIPDITCRQNEQYDQTKQRCVCAPGYTLGN